MRLDVWLLAAVIALLEVTGSSPADLVSRNAESWTLKEAVSLLNESPWARQQTATRVVGGIGSGVFGEKEIFSRYYVRLLSAWPVRQAYKRVDQILAGQGQPGSSKAQPAAPAGGSSVQAFDDRWIVIGLCFRSNDPEQQQRVYRHLQAQTTGSLKSRAYLSTRKFRQIQLQAFYPAVEDSVGVKFVFPKQIGGVPIVTTEDKEFVFEVLCG